jgi:hypothetical protein
MDDFLKTLDWRVRAGMSASLAGLCGILAWLAARSAISGPWFLGIGSIVAAALCANVVDRSWPSKLPDRLSDPIDKWKQARSRSTKTKPGRFVWNLGRSMAAAMAAWHLLSLVDDLSWYAKASATLGFGGAFGFFGLEGALWSGAIVATLAHFSIYFGLGTDLADPSKRAGFLSSWNANQVKLSWLWPIAFAATGPLWIGIGAGFKSIKDKLSEEMGQRRTAASDKKRIEARRLRMKVRHESSGEDPLDKARKRLEEAQDRVKALGRGNALVGIGEDADGAAVPAADRELTGVEKLEKENMVETLRRYSEQVRSIRQNEKDGLDVMTGARHGFDRVIQNMSDAWISHLRSDDSDSSRTLIDYYDGLCSVEDKAMRSGDGEVVVSSGWQERSEEDELDGFEPSGYGTPPAETDEQSLLGFGFGGDLLDDDVPAPLVDSFLGSDRGSVAPEEMPMMLSVAPKVEPESLPAVLDDGTPAFDGNLPVDDDVSETESGLMEGESIQEPEVLGDGDGIEPHVGHDANPGDDLLETGVRDDAVDVDGSPIVEARTDADERDEGTDSDEAGFDEDTRGDETLGEAVAENVASTQVETTEPDPGATPATAILHDDADADLQGKTVIDEETQPGSTGTVDERREAAGLILSDKADRAFVIRTAGWFSSAEETAAALGLPSIMFEQPYAKYSTKVEAAGVERQLELALSAEDATIDAVSSAATALEGAGWEHDAALVARARTWVADQIEKERIRAEEEARRIAELAREAQRLREEDEARAAEAAREAERILQAERDRIAEEAAETQRRADEESRRIAEETRQSELSAKRTNVAGAIIAGSLPDDVLDMGAELFPDAQSLADVFGLPISVVESRFEEFSTRSDVRQKYQELGAAFQAEDVNAVEALLERPESFVGYDHPNFDIEGIRSWAKGVRAKERIQGLTDGDRQIVSSGGASRRQFMIKRTRIDAETADMIDVGLPKEMRLVKSLNEVIGLMGDNATDAMKAPMQEARDRVRRLAARIVTPKDGKDVAKEYAMAFLPDDVRGGRQDVWELLLELASNVDQDEDRPTGTLDVVDQVPSPDPVAEDDHEEEIEEEVHVEEVVEAPVVPATPSGRIKIAASFDPNPRRSLEEVQAMDSVEEVRLLSHPGRFDQGSTARSQMISLREVYGVETERMVEVADDGVYATIRNESGERIGKVLIRTEGGAAPAWNDASTRKVIMKNAVTGKVTMIPESTFKNMLSVDVVAPNGDPDTVIGLALVSPVINDDGITSFQPVLEDFGGRVRILSSSDSKGIQTFVREMSF